jgi:Phosphoribosyl-ATP pyrophosphohydrolase
MTTLRNQVREFHLAMDVPVDAPKPTIIPDTRVRLRCALIAEEFFETLEAMMEFTPRIDELRTKLMTFLLEGDVDVSMPRGSPTVSQISTTSSKGLDSSSGSMALRSPPRSTARTWRKLEAPSLRMVNASSLPGGRLPTLPES